jgi:hypothetical protein
MRQMAMLFSQPKNPACCPVGAPFFHELNIQGPLLNQARRPHFPRLARRTAHESTPLSVGVATIGGNRPALSCARVPPVHNGHNPVGVLAAGMTSLGMSSPVLKWVVSWRGSRGSGAVGGGSYRPMRKPLRESRDSSAEAPGSPSWGDWRTKSQSTSRPDATPLGLPVTAGDGGPGSSRSAIRERYRPGA